MNISKKQLAAALIATAVAPVAIAGGNIEHGKELVTANQCGVCHGANFDTPITPNYPKLAGQHPDYLAHALMAYKDSANPWDGRKNAVMAGQAQKLSASDIQDVAAYIGSLPGSIETHK